jgi:GMP synthase-like glutamine amidotransferase
VVVKVTGSVDAKPALIFQHGRLGPPDRVAEWLDERGLPFVVHRAGSDTPAAVGDFSFLVSLGAEESAAGSEPAWVPAEVAMLRDAVDAGVPVLGLCFGGQALSLALGGGVDRLARPEIGWFALESVDGGGVPAGPWLMWHNEQLRVPPGGVELARSPAGPAAFVCGPHLGVQFHPEVDVKRVRSWAEEDQQLADLGLTVEDLVAAAEQHAPATRDQAFAMFDWWLDRAREPTRRPSPSHAVG